MRRTPKRLTWTEGNKCETYLPSKLQAKHHKAFPFPLTPAPVASFVPLPPSLNEEVFFLMLDVVGLGGIASGLAPPSFAFSVVGLVTTVEAAVDEESVLESRRGRRKEEERLAGVEVLSEEVGLVGEEGGERVVVGEGAGEGEGGRERGESVRGMAGN